MKKTKRIVLCAALVVFCSMLLLSVVGSSAICGAGNLSCRGNIGNIFTFLYSIPLVLLFSLITYKLRDEVFRAWWNFALWWIPVIIAVTIFLNNASGTGGGYIGMGQDFMFLIQGILYAVLILVSLVKIIRAYNKK